MEMWNALQLVKSMKDKLLLAMLWHYLNSAQRMQKFLFNHMFYFVFINESNDYQSQISVENCKSKTGARNIYQISIKTWMGKHLFTTNFHVFEKTVVRSSRPEVFCKECVLRNFTKFTGKQVCQGLFFNKKNLINKIIKKEEALSHLFSCEFC